MNQDRNVIRHKQVACRILTGDALGATALDIRLAGTQNGAQNFNR